ncbi:unnamed protein product, partial [Laminaria digitata]
MDTPRSCLASCRVLYIYTRTRTSSYKQHHHPPFVFAPFRFFRFLTVFPFLNFLFSISPPIFRLFSSYIVPRLVSCAIYILLPKRAATTTPPSPVSLIYVLVYPVRTSCRMLYIPGILLPKNQQLQ